MKEYVAKAIVLAKEDWGETDSRVFLYSPDYGKIIARIKSSKGILSKLNSHLEPFNFVSVRVLEKWHQIADALLIEKLSPSWAMHQFLNFVKEVTFEGESDYYFWSLVKMVLITGRADYRRLLAVRGFDPQFAFCQNCQRPNPSHFFYQGQDFWCRGCFLLNNFSEEQCSNGFIKLS